MHLCIQFVSMNASILTVNNKIIFATLTTDLGESHRVQIIRLTIYPAVIITYLDLYMQ